MVLEMHAVGALVLRKWLMVAPLLAGLGTLAAPGAAEERAAAPGSASLVAIEATLRSSFALPTLAGATHELAALRGRVVLVHFFATWCEPCRAEIASLRELQSRLDGQPFAIVPISVAEADGAVRRFFAADPPPFAICSIATARSPGRGTSIRCHRPSCWTAACDRASSPKAISTGRGPT